MQMALNQEVQAKMQELDANSRKIETKDNMWKPAPIVGKEMTNPAIIRQPFN